MHRVWAIIERDLRRFRRSPTLMIVSMVMPLVQLVVLGYAFGGKVKSLHLGVVDQDHAVPAVQLKEMFQAVAANARTFDTVAYNDQAAALHDLRILANSGTGAGVAFQIAKPRRYHAVGGVRADFLANCIGCAPQHRGIRVDCRRI